MSVQLRNVGGDRVPKIVDHFVDGVAGIISVIAADPFHAAAECRQRRPQRADHGRQPNDLAFAFGEIQLANFRSRQAKAFEAVRILVQTVEEHFLFGLQRLLMLLDLAIYFGLDHRRRPKAKRLVFPANRVSRQPWPNSVFPSTWLQPAEFRRRNSSQPQLFISGGWHRSVPLPPPLP